MLMLASRSSVSSAGVTAASFVRLPFFVLHVRSADTVGCREIPTAYPGARFGGECVQVRLPSAVVAMALRGRLHREDLTVPAVVEHLECVVSQIEPAPIVMGHSAGGVFMKVLMDRGYGAAGVAINSAPTEGVKRVPLSQIRSSFPVLKNPANRHKAVGFTFEEWRYVFTIILIATRPTSTRRRPSQPFRPHRAATPPATPPARRRAWN
jgi:hypothetical protein